MTRDFALDLSLPRTYLTSHPFHPCIAGKFDCVRSHKGVCLQTLMLSPLNIVERYDAKEM